MSRLVAIAAVVMLAAAACGGGEAAEPANTDPVSFDLLAIADFQWAADPGAGFTTPFSFEVLAPVVDGSVDLSYWLELHDASGASAGGTPRSDFTVDSERDYEQISLSHALPVPVGIEGSYSMIIFVRDNQRGATTSHVVELVLS